MINNTYFTKLKQTRVATLAATIITFGSLAGGANGAITININEVGLDVVTSYSGTFNHAGLTFQSTFEDTNTGMGPGGPFIELGSIGVLVDDYLYSGVVTGDGAFGSGTFTSTINVSGDHFTMGAFNDFRVPAGYVSGAPLSGTATYLNESFASIGITEGVYNYQWGSGLDQDSVTINIGSVIPEPSSAALLFGLGTLGLVARRRRTA